MKFSKAVTVNYLVSSRSNFPIILARVSENVRVSYLYLQPYMKCNAGVQLDFNISV